MTTKARRANLPVSEDMAAQAQELTAPSSTTARLVLKAPDGTERVLPEDLQSLLKQVLLGAAKGENLRIGRVADELTSTVAADTLGVSRPTLMKMVERGEIRSFKVGTHTRFHRSEVDRVRDERRQDRMAAFAELRQLDDELGLDD